MRSAATAARDVLLRSFRLQFRFSGEGGCRLFFLLMHQQTEAADKAQRKNIARQIESLADRGKMAASPYFAATTAGKTCVRSERNCCSSNENEQTADLITILMEVARLRWVTTPARSSS
jgi:hypothetical protein